MSQLRAFPVPQLHIADVGAQMKPPDVARLWGEARAASA